jgi:hypothetical protein
MWPKGRAGSTPVPDTNLKGQVLDADVNYLIFRPVSSAVERLHHKQEAAGPIPAPGTTRSSSNG